MWHQPVRCKPRPCLASLHARRYTYGPVRRQPHALSTGVGPHKENAVKFHAFMYVTIGRRRELERGMAGKNPVLYQRMLGCATRLAMLASASRNITCKSKGLNWARIQA